MKTRRRLITLLFGVGASLLVGGILLAKRGLDGPEDSEASNTPVPPGEAPPGEAPPGEAPPGEAPPDEVGALVDGALRAADRLPEDRLLDEQRKPRELLSFFELAPGQRVAELGTGKGYTAELLARIVGPTGAVYAQNNRFILERFAEGPWSERLQRPAMRPVTRVDAEFDAPLPEEASSSLDLVLNILFYHDTVWFGTDREAMNRAIFAALRPGGLYGIVDHSARKGAGVSEAKSLHRIEESVLRAEIEAAGFVFVASADFLRNPADSLDWSTSPSTAGARRGESDRFVLKFRKPATK